MRIRKKIKILMISSSSELGGGTKHMFLLGQNLSNEFKVYYAIPSNDIFVKYLNEKNHINISERKISLKDLYNIYKFSILHSIDIIHAHGKGAGLIARIVNIFLRRKLIYTFHGIHYKCHNFLRRNLYLLYENILGILDTIKIFVSKSEKEYAMNLNIKIGNNSTIINNGVINRKIKEIIKTSKDLSKIKKNKKINVISVCRLVNQKNIIEIVEIAKILPNINFLILGDGDLYEEIKNIISSRNIRNVFLKGRKKNVFKYLYSADIYLSTSLYEGLPLSIIESMSIGLPIIASNVIGNKDTIENGKSGYLYDLNDINMAAKYINLLANDYSLRENLGNLAFKRQRKLFSFNKMIFSYEKLYFNVFKK